MVVTKHYVYIQKVFVYLCLDNFTITEKNVDIWIIFYILPANVPVVKRSIMLFNFCCAAFLASASALKRNSIATDRLRIMFVLPSHFLYES